MPDNRENLTLQDTNRIRDHCLLTDKHFGVSITGIFNFGVLCNANFEQFTNCLYLCLDLPNSLQLKI